MKQKIRIFEEDTIKRSSKKLLKAGYRPATAEEIFKLSDKIKRDIWITALNKKGPVFYVGIKRKNE